MDEFLKLMSVLTGDSQYEIMLKKEDFQKRKKGGITMCNVLDYHKAEGKVEGKKEARNELIIQMYEEGLPSEQIARIARLSVEEVEQIRDSAEK